MPNTSHRRIGKIDLVRVNNPNGSGHSYFAKAEPEGYVLIANMGDADVSVYAGIVAWELEKQEPLLWDKHIQPVFNKQGWVY